MKIIWLSLGLLVLAACSQSEFATKATIYKSQQCGCCGNYVSYLEGKGFDVNVVQRDNLAPLKEELGIPGNMQSCHTTVIGDYVIEGHVPVEAIEKLLSEKPDIKGIALPGMPSASPGMPGSKDKPFQIMKIEKDGSVNEFMQV